MKGSIPQMQLANPKKCLVIFLRALSSDLKVVMIMKYVSTVGTLNCENDYIIFFETMSKIFAFVNQYQTSTIKFLS